MKKPLRAFIADADARGDLDTWRRGRGVLGYVEGQRVMALAELLGVTRGSVNRWPQRYESMASRDSRRSSRRARHRSCRTRSTMSSRASSRRAFFYQFAPVFNGRSFLTFLEDLVARCRRKSVIDNGPCHRLDEAGKRWLAEHHHRIALVRLPPYSPELNPIEGVWKWTKKSTTHSRFYRSVEERDAAPRPTPSGAQVTSPGFPDPRPARFCFVPAEIRLGSASSHLPR